MRRPSAFSLSLALLLSAGLSFAATAQDQAPAGDKTPQPRTIGPAAPLSAAQRAAIAAKPIVVMPAPAAPQASAAAKALDAGAAARAPQLPTANPLIRMAPPAGAMPVRGPAREGPMLAGRARPHAPESAWTTSAALGSIPRLSWRIPALVKPAERIWVATPSGGEQLPVPVKSAPAASGGGR